MQVLSPSPLLLKNALTNLVALLLLFRFLFLTSTEDESWKRMFWILMSAEKLSFAQDGDEAGLTNLT